jgi:MarR family transcriptional regulator, transcriptional regulator for hemolysin
VAVPAEIPTLTFLLHDTARMVRGEFLARAGTTQFTPQQWRTLAYLARMEGCQQCELAAVVEVRPITIGRLLDRMQRMQLVERRRDAADRRVQRVYLTPRARAAVREMRAIGRRCSDRAVRGLSAAERRTLTALLVRVRANLGDARRATNGAGGSR